MIDNTEILKRLDKISDISSPYAQFDENNFSIYKQQMEKELSNFEELVVNWSSLLHERFALAYRNYCSWYIRGDEREKVLRKVIFHLTKSIDLDNENINSKVELTRILVEEKTVRDLKKALEISHELKKSNQLPSWMDSIIEKAKRWTGEINIPVNTNFKGIDPSPAVFREERIKLRKLLTELQKNEDEKKSIVAKRLYNLGLYVTKLYGSHDCNSGVMGISYDNALKNSKKIANEFSYEYLGRIDNCKFLTEQDYKKIEKVFGNKSEIIDVNKLVFET